ncbi:hypothetical protein [Candidatus Tisiphia endosymbiont of Sialis lutaria]
MFFVYYTSLILISQQSHYGKRNYLNMHIKHIILQLKIITI